MSPPSVPPPAHRRPMDGTARRGLADGRRTIRAMPVGLSSGVLDLLLGIGAAGTLVALIRAWRTFWDDDFTDADRKLSLQVAAFLIPPVVVLFHELGHFYAAHLVGARVTAFHYGFFEGSVTAVGLRTRFDVWFMALAGNLVSALIGLGLVTVALRGRHLRRPLRHVLLVGGLLELVFSLVAYPVLSLTSRFGDWILIYRSDGAPALAWGTAIVHVAALYAVWQWWRTSGKATLFAIGSGEQATLETLQRAVREQPAEPGSWLS